MSAGVHALAARMCHSEISKKKIPDRKMGPAGVNDVDAPEACAEDFVDLKKSQRVGF